MLSLRSITPKVTLNVQIEYQWVLGYHFQKVILFQLCQIDGLKYKDSEFVTAIDV